MSRFAEHQLPVTVDVCICTFRRPQLAETIRSIAALRIPANVTLRIIVADNDVVASARDNVEALKRDMPNAITYVHAPARNISIARNACLDNSTGDFAAFIDDDETAAPDWLGELLEKAAETGADAVLGPVRASYDQNAPAWMQRGDFHSTFPVWVRGLIRTGYTCNVLLRRSRPAIANWRFDPALGQSGGEDTDFFSRLHEAGGTIAYAPEAWVYETVPKTRATLSWLARRRFRMGQTHGRLLAEKHRGTARFAQLGLAAGKAAYCFMAAAALGFSTHRRNRYVLRGILHTGTVGGLIGYREIRQYGGVPQEGAGRHAA